MSKQHTVTYVFTGGGTGGHIIPNLAIIAALKKQLPTARIVYIGSRDPFEKSLIPQDIPHISIQTGKLRRYPSLKNLTDSLRIPVGIAEALYHLLRLRPQAVFSKGGFVAVPVCIAAWLLRIPLIIHESDATPGLTTRITAPLAQHILTAFPGVHSRGVTVGTPTRPRGNALRGRAFLALTGRRRPLLLIVGGSTGSTFLNDLTHKLLPRFLRHASVVWITGNGKTPAYSPHPQLRVYPFLSKEYADVLAASSLVITRGGANALFELAATAKPTVIIPLPKAGSRGDQIDNARYFAEKNAALIFTQDTLIPKHFGDTVLRLLHDPLALSEHSRAIARLATKHTATRIADLLISTRT